MKTYPLCDPYVWEDPRVLLDTRLSWRNRKEGPCASEIVNHIVLVYLLALIAAVVFQAIFKNPIIIVAIMLLATAYCFPSFYALITIRADYTEGYKNTASQKEGLANMTAGAKKEGFSETATDATTATSYELYDIIGSTGNLQAAPATLTLPTARNPFMNVLVDELKYRPKRAMAASVYDPSVKVALDDFFRTDFHRDPTDVFGKSQSQREFITMPSTSIPNDQGSYQNWLYKIPGKTCKEGGRDACMPGTDGGRIPWLNVNP
jgi:hypothetical protein